MRSPLGGRFPAVLVASTVIVLAGAACTPEADSDGGDVTASPDSISATAEIGGDNASETSVGGGREHIARIRDADRKRTVRGTAPPYVEIDSAWVEGSIDALRLGVELAERVPRRMPDDESILRVTFTATTTDGRRYTFEAQCIRPGWGAFATGGPENAAIPEIAIDGRRIELTVDPAYLGGLQPFKWLANVAWTAGDANYAFDAAPKRGVAGFP